MRFTMMTRREWNTRLALIAMDAKLVAIDIAMLAVEMRLRLLDIEYVDEPGSNCDAK